MVKGLYTAGLGMTTQWKRMDVVANNIANVNTTGYKKDSVATQSFSEEFIKRLNDPGTAMFGGPVTIGKMTKGVFVDTVFTSWAPGSVRVTENMFDLAIEGDGFFAVEVAGRNGAAEKYTRDGEFTMVSGRLLTRDGAGVLGNNGAITLPETSSVIIDEAGNIYADGVYVNTIKIVDFTDKSTLRSLHNNMFETTADSVFKDATGRIKQGAIESANVFSAIEMVDMITINRAYEANQRSILTIDNTLNRAVNDLGNKR